MSSRYMNYLRKNAKYIMVVMGDRVHVHVRDWRGLDGHGQ